MAVDAQTTTPPSGEVQERPFLTLRITGEALAYFLLIAIGGAMRFWDLGSRAFHHDESLHAYFSWLFYDGRGYQHNPLMHGTFQFHAWALSYSIFGDSDYTARIPTAFLGTALIGLPFFLRGYLGRWGALVAAAFIAFSPLLLYFSRFAREDAFMAFWTMLLVVFMWRYIAEQKPAYLYGLVAVLALAFATKESIYILVVIFGSFMFFLWLDHALQRYRERKNLRAGLEEAGVAITKTGIDLRSLAAPGVILLLLFTLSLPLWAPLLYYVQDGLGVTLVNPADRWQEAPVGSPVGDRAFGIATIAVLFLLGVSIIIGMGWNRKVWLTAALIFFGVFIFFFSTVFTHLSGVGSGVWQSLGYWVAQQSVQRGNQPYYYYLVIIPLYEFLPLTFAFIGTIYAIVRRADTFTWFLVYWIVMAFVLFSWAGEKMPWLTVNMALPLALLGGKFLGELLEKVPWRKVWQQGGMYLLVLVPLFLMVLNGVIGWGGADEGKLGASSLGRILLILLAAAVGASIWYVLKRIGVDTALRVVALAAAVILFFFTFRAGWQASYRNGDVPREMLVYTQTSPDIPRIRDEIQRFAFETGEGKNLRILVDGADGFQWPWAWYLRDYKFVSYPDLSITPLQAPPDAAVVIVNASNRSSSERFLSDFTPGHQARLRWWFPEESYRGLTPKKLAEKVKQGGQWQGLGDYLFYRKLSRPLNSVDVVVYFRKGLE